MPFFNEPAWDWEAQFIASARDAFGDESLDFEGVAAALTRADGKRLLEFTEYARRRQYQRGSITLDDLQHAFPAAPWKSLGRLL